MCGSWSIDEWIQRLKASNDEARNCLWGKLNKWASQFCQKWQFDETIGEDAALVAFNKIHTIVEDEPRKIKTNFLGYCKVILLNKIKDNLPNATILNFEDEFWETVGVEDDNIQNELSDDAQNALRSCLNTITDKQRKAVQLRFLDDPPLSSKAAAKMMYDDEKKNGNVDQLVHSALRKLRNCLGGKGFDHRGDCY